MAYILKKGRKIDMQFNLFAVDEITSVTPAPLKDVLPVVKIEGFKEVDREEFYKVIGPQDVHPRIIGDKYPYTSYFKTKNGQTKGIVSESWATDDGKWPKVKRYYLPV